METYKLWKVLHKTENLNCFKKKIGEYLKLQSKKSKISCRKIIFEIEYQLKQRVLPSPNSGLQKLGFWS